MPTPLNHRVLSTLAAAGLAAALGLSACGAPAEETATEPTPSTSPAEPETTEPADSPTPTTAPTTTPTQEAESGASLDIEVTGEDISPNAEEISLKAGEPLAMSFDADRAGELHVHAKPEQYVDFEAGRSQQEIVIDTPGTVEIEEHESGAVVAVVEVR